MAALRIREEDIAGITLAVLAHAGLIAWLALAPRPAPPPPVERVTVTLDAPVSADAGSPSREEAQAAVAPVIAPEPAPAPAPAPVPAPVAKVTPAPPQPAPPKPVVRPAPAPKAITPPQPQRKPPPRQVKQPAPQAKQPTGGLVSNNFLKDLRPAPKTGGGSRVGDKFLDGVKAGADKGKAATPPGPAITPELRVSFAQAVLRQVRPNWQGRVPQGVDVELLVSVISVELNRDGTLARDPVLLRQEGVNDANRAQARRHAEEAIRAVKLSAPFRLPADAYEGWKTLPPLRFRKGN